MVVHLPFVEHEQGGYLMAIERLCCMHGWAIGDVALFEEFGDNSHMDASLSACCEDSKCDIPYNIF